jgi:predicted adenine nucleotide alpha hydrolase (AANH) superfamily ATPase
LERVAREFAVTIYYYNPNMDTADEFRRRAGEIEKLRGLGLEFEVIVEEYRPEEYDLAVRGKEDLGEGSARCYCCYGLRLRKTAAVAAREGFTAFGTTLSISPHKKIGWIREIGLMCEKEFGVRYLDEDFKKRDGYKRSLELSRELQLYRQDYCGCRYSKAEAAARKNVKMEVE